METVSGILVVAMICGAIVLVQYMKRRSELAQTRIIMQTLAELDAEQIAALLAKPEPPPF